MVLGIVLTLVVVALGYLLVAVVRKDQLIRRNWVSLVVVVLGLLLLLTLRWHTNGRSDRLHRSALQMEYTGVIVHAGTNRDDLNLIVLRGGPMPDRFQPGIRWSPLREKDEIHLTPKFEDGRLKGFKVSARTTGHIVRADSNAVQLPIGRWIASKRDSETFSFSKVGDEDNAARFQLVCDGPRVRLRSVPGEPDDEWQTNSVRIVRRFSLGDLVEETDIANVANDSGRLKEDLTNALGEQLAAEVLDKVIIVRQESYEGDTAIGLVNCLPDQHLDELTITPASDENRPTVFIPAGGRISINGDGIVVPETINLADGDMRFSFSPPPRYRLPRKGEGLSKSELMLSTSNPIGSGRALTDDNGVPVPLYVFDTGWERDVPMRKVSVQPDYSLSSVLREELSPLAPANTEFTIDASIASPVVRLYDAVSIESPKWRWAGLGIFLSVCWVCFWLKFDPGTFKVFSKKHWKGRSKYFLDGRGKKAASYVPIAIWMVAVAMLIVRGILAYRVTVLPPSDLTAGLRADATNAWTNAVWAIFVGCILSSILAVKAHHRMTRRPILAKTEDKPRPSSQWLRALPHNIGEYLRTKPIHESLLAIAAVLGFCLFANQRAPYLKGIIPDFLLTYSRLPVVVAVLFAGIIMRAVYNRRSSENSHATEPPTNRPKLPSIIGAYTAQIVYSAGFVLTFIATRSGHSPLLQSIGAALVLFAVTAPWVAKFLKVPSRISSWSTWPGMLAIFIVVTLGDYGFLLFLVVLVSAWSAFGYWKHSDTPSDVSRGLRRARGLACPLVSIVLVLGVFSMDRVAMLAPSVPMLGSTGVARFLASSTSASEAMTSGSLAINNIDGVGHQFYRSIVQRWRMQEDVAAAGQGFLQTDLSVRGLEFNTLITDASFTSLLIVEHGRWAAWMVIGLLVFAGVLLTEVSRLYADRFRAKHKVIGLLASGWCLSFIAAYMSLATLWRVPFTGQNVPFLSPTSSSELGLTAVLVISPLLFCMDSLSGRKTRPGVAIIWRSGLSSVAVVLWVVLGITLVKHPRDPIDFNYSQEFYSEVGVLAADWNAQVRRATSSTEPKMADSKSIVYSSAPAMVKYYARKFDRSRLQAIPIQWSPDDQEASPDTYALKIISPHNKTGVWRGELIARASKQHSEVSLDGTLVSMEVGAGTKDVVVGKPVTFDVTQSIEFRTDSDDKLASYGGVHWSSDGELTLSINETNKKASVYLNGERVQDTIKDEKLQPLDVVNIKLEDRPSRSSSVTLQYLGSGRNTISFVAWINGTWRRFYPRKENFPLASSMVATLNGRDLAWIKENEDYEISLRSRLSWRLQDMLKLWAVEHSRAVSSDSWNRGEDMTAFTSLTLIDSFSGQILALPGLPQIDPSLGLDELPRFERDEDLIVAHRGSWSMRQAMIGSTTKPISLATLALGLNTPDFDIGKVVVNEAARNSGFKRTFGQLELKRGLPGAGSPWNGVTMHVYLRNSRTWTAIYTDLLGMTETKGMAGFLQAVTPGNPVDIEYEGKKYTLDLHGNKALITQPGRLLSPQALNRTVYFQSLQEIGKPFVLDTFRSDPKYTDAWTDSYFPGVNRSQIALSLLPAKHWANTTSLAEGDELARYLLGTGNSNWSGLVMATLMARLSTGLFVQPTWNPSAEMTSALAPGPIGDKAWRDKRIIQPLSEISTLGPGWLASRNRQLKKRGLRVIAKTGTADDGRGSDAWESELVMFTIGRYDKDTGFIPGKTITGFLSLKRTQPKQGGVYLRRPLFDKVLTILEQELAREDGD